MDDKKRKKKYYKQSATSNKKFKTRLQLDINMKGFLITCNNNEKQTVVETYNILNEYADKIYGSEEHLNQTKNDSDDIESALQEQINSLKSNLTERRFKNLDTNINNCIFIKTTLPDPNILVDNIFNTNNKACNVRFIQRMLPVIKTCKANEENIEKMAEEHLLPVFANLDPAPTFAIIYKVRNNNSINKGMIFTVIGRVISNINPLAKVHLNDPEIVISVDVMQKICCLSILRHYKNFKKYNLHVLGDNNCQKHSALKTSVDANIEDKIDKSSDAIGIDVTNITVATNLTNTNDTYVEDETNADVSAEKNLYCDIKSNSEIHNTLEPNSLTDSKSINVYQ